MFHSMLADSTKYEDNINMSVKIRAMNAGDWIQVRDIYRQGIETGNATFEVNIPEWDEWNQRHLEKCRLVAADGEVVVGWAALSSVSARTVYSGVAEVSIYVKLSARSKGIGSSLLRRLIEISEEAGIWTLQAGIFPENTESIKLHMANGFREIGIRERPGKLHGRWRDVVLLERRSKSEGL
jgi:L-amino acid N-acyltransferase YncA